MSSCEAFRAGRRDRRSGGNRDVLHAGDARNEHGGDEHYGQTHRQKGGGLYEGTGVLGSGGSWQVTITAHKDGKAIASKQMRVSAEGEM